jgi:hypothetical protein
VVARTLGIAEAVEGHLALAAEVERRIRAVLEDRDDVSARCADLVVGLTQLGEVLAAERSAEVAHEGHDQGAVAPAIRKLNLSVARLERDVGKRVPGVELAHRGGAYRV